MEDVARSFASSALKTIICASSAASFVSGTGAFIEIFFVVSRWPFTGKAFFELRADFVLSVFVVFVALAAALPLLEESPALSNAAFCVSFFGAFFVDSTAMLFAVLAREAGIVFTVLAAVAALPVRFLGETSSADAWGSGIFVLDFEVIFNAIFEADPAFGIDDTFPTIVLFAMTFTLLNRYRVHRESQRKPELPPEGVSQCGMIEAAGAGTQ